ncbi:MAG: excinuclease ABC subunit B, partial [Candidatus Thorarchaeota archaeon]|nr:excinuclease ABC subunit B [Candidatus Thorarchaeota archaeon]NIW15764.1 excinuclease ABC subunit B [Candidatus Thorarchaeota archaeon]
YNEKHGITPETIKKELKPLVDPSLISSQSFDFAKKDEEPDEEALEVIRVADEGIQYKASPAMKEVTFESKDKLIEHLRET